VPSPKLQVSLQGGPDPSTRQSEQRLEDYWYARYRENAADRLRATWHSNTTEQRQLLGLTRRSEDVGDV
jgi:hypothetical protein